MRNTLYFSIEMVRSKGKCFNGENVYIECFQHSLAHRRALLNLPDNLATRGQRMIPKQNSIASFVPRITRVLKLQTHKCRPLSSPSDSLPTVSETRIVRLCESHQLSRETHLPALPPSFSKVHLNTDYVYTEHSSSRHIPTVQNNIDPK